VLATDRSDPKLRHPVLNPVNIGPRARSENFLYALARNQPTGVIAYAANLLVALITLASQPLMPAFFSIILTMSGTEDMAVGNLKKRLKLLVLPTVSPDKVMLG
jgi:hypothetical protein